MSRVLASALRFVRDENGVSLVEYVLTLILVVTVVFAGMSLVFSSIASFFESFGASI
jgi:Flp pilus assembly pilin Flp